MHAPVPNLARRAGHPAGGCLGLGQVGPGRTANPRCRRHFSSFPGYLTHFRGNPAFLREHASFVPEAKRFEPEAKWFVLEAISFVLGAKSFMPEAKSFVLGAKRFVPGHASFVLEAKPRVLEHEAFVPKAKSFVPGTFSPGQRPERRAPALVSSRPTPSSHAHRLFRFRRPGNVFRQSESKVGLTELSLGGWRSGICPAHPVR